MDFAAVPTAYVGAVPTAIYVGAVPTAIYIGAVPTAIYIGAVPTAMYVGAVPIAYIQYILVALHWCILAYTLSIYVQPFFLSRGVESKAAMTSFVRQLQATDKFLGQISLLSTSSDVQKQRVKILIDLVPLRGPWASEACAFACEAVNSCKHISDENKEALLKRICMEVDDTSKLVLQSKPKQDYTNVLHMVPQDVWDVLMDPVMPLEDHVVRICQLCQSLGLVRPTEKTYSVMTCLVYWVHWKDCMPDGKRKNWFLHQAKPLLKQYLQHFQDTCPVPPDMQLACLPMHFDELPRAHQALFEKRGKPVQCNDHCKVICLNMPTRVTKRECKLDPKMVKPLTPLPTPMQIQVQHASALPQPALPAARAPPLPLDDVKPEVPALQLSMKSTVEDQLVKEQQALQAAVKEQQALVACMPAARNTKPKSGKASVFETLANLKLKLESKKDADQQQGQKQPKASSKKSKEIPMAEEKVADKPVKATKSKATAKKAKQMKECDQQKEQRDEKNSDQELKHKSENASKVTPKKSPKKQKSPKAAKSPKKTGQPKPLPKWWNCKKELLLRFPDDTAKRYCSRCYHHVVKNEKLKGLVHELAKLAGQKAHSEARDRWNVLFPPN